MYSTLYNSVNYSLNVAKLANCLSIVLNKTFWRLHLLWNSL